MTQEEFTSMYLTEEEEINYNRNMIDMGFTFNTDRILNEHINYYFTWCYTTEGYSYWSTINDRVNSGTKIDRHSIKRHRMI
jgi:hypothetical protein